MLTNLFAAPQPRGDGAAFHIWPHLMSERLLCVPPPACQRPWAVLGFLISVRQQVPCTDKALTLLRLASL